jgi:Lipocalin-like domain
MKKLYCLTVLLFGATSFFTSCKKNDKTNTCALNEANFSGSYKIESVKYKLSSTTPEIDGTSFFDACEIDDVTTFKTDHTYTYTDAGTTCTPSGDDNGTWSLSGSNLTVDGAAEPVANFSCTGFTVSETDVNTTGDKITITFKKQ